MTFTWSWDAMSRQLQVVCTGLVAGRDYELDSIYASADGVLGTADGSGDLTVSKSVDLLSVAGNMFMGRLVDTITADYVAVNIFTVDVSSSGDGVTATFHHNGGTGYSVQIPTVTGVNYRLLGAGSGGSINVPFAGDGTTQTISATGSAFSGGTELLYVEAHTIAPFAPIAAGILIPGTAGDSANHNPGGGTYNPGFGYGTAGVAIAFFDDTLSPTPTFVPIDAYTQGWDVDHRGRVFELDRNETGTATLHLVDPNGDLDPTNPDGPFYGQIQVLKQMQIGLRNPVTGLIGIVFTGFVEEWGYVVDTAQSVLTVTVSCVDGFDILSATEVVPDGTGQASYAQQHADDAINARLDDAGWPTGSAWRHIFTGNVQVQAVKYQAGTDILSTIQDCADAEFPGVANVYMDKLGRVTFHGRYARFLPADYTANGITVWNAADETGIEDAGDDSWAKIAEIEWNLDKKNLFNAVIATPEHIAMADIAGQLVTDPTSISQYGIRALKLDGLLTSNTTDDGYHALDECKLFGLYYIDNYAQPVQRISRLVFKSVSPDDPTNAGTWALLCGIEIGDVVNVLTHNPGNGGFAAPGTPDAGLGFFVEGISYQVTLGNDRYPQVVLTLDVSPQAWFTTFPSIT